MRGYLKKRKERLYAWAVVIFIFSLGGTLLGMAQWRRAHLDPYDDWEKSIHEAVEMGEEETLITIIASDDLGDLLSSQRAGWVLEPSLLEEGNKRLSGEVLYRYAREISCDLPRVAIVVDDVGYNAAMARKLAKIPIPLTWAIIPGLKGTHPCSKVADEANIPYMVHMPMQATGDKKGGRWYDLSWIVSGQSEATVQKAVARALEELPDAVGMNNHRGSLSTTDEALMVPFMKALGERQLGFIDSRTIRGSVAYAIAKRHGLPSAYNSVFIDHYNDEKFMKEQLSRLVSLAKRHGWAVGICHIRSGTLKMLAQLDVSHFEGVRFVTVPELFSCLGRP